MPTPPRYRLRYVRRRLLAGLSRDQWQPAESALQGVLESNVSMKEGMELLATMQREGVILMRSTSQIPEVRLA